MDRDGDYNFVQYVIYTFCNTQGICRVVCWLWFAAYDFLQPFTVVV